MATALNFTRVNATKEGYVRHAYAVHGNETYYIGLMQDRKWTPEEPYTRYHVEVVSDGKATFSQVMLVPDILRFLYNRELATLGIKPIDVEVNIPFASPPYKYIAKVFYADPECSHVQVI